MYIPHNDALKIESGLKKIFKEDDSPGLGLGGIINADFCEKKPLIAIISGLAKVYSSNNKQKIDSFIMKNMENINFSIKEVGEEKIDMIIKEFKSLIK